MPDDLFAERDTALVERLKAAGWTPYVFQGKRMWRCPEGHGWPEFMAFKLIAPEEEKDG